MRIREVSIERVGPYTEASLVLPQYGVVLISGANGAGKSMWIEAVALGLFGKSLRGATAWAAPDASVTVSLQHPDLRIRAPFVVERTRRGGKVSLACSREATFENTTKAQAHVESVLGVGFEAWKQSSVFSSGDAARFTMASDSERKRLLETLLGHDKVEEAHTRALEALRAARSDLAEKKSEHASLVRELAVWESVRADALQTLAAHRSDASLLALDAQSESALQARVDATQLELDDATTDHLCAERAQAQVTSELATARRLVAAHKQAAACPTCKRPLGEGNKQVDEKAREQAEQKVIELEAKLTSAERSVKQAWAWLQKLATALAEQRNRVEEEKRKNAMQAMSAKRQAEAQERATNAEEKVRLVTASVANAAALLAQSERSVAVAEEVAVALSTAGARSLLLADALGWVEEVANRWLTMLVPNNPMSVHLTATTEKAKGGVKDAIALEVTGAGGGFGYKASSAGERRRIDLAMLLALHEVATIVNPSTSRATLWFDEVLDSLDADSVEAVLGVLAQLSEDRCVVVVTHSEALASSLREASTVDVVHYHAVDGMLVTR